MRPTTIAGVGTGAQINDGIKLLMGAGGARRGMTFCDRRGNGGWTNPRFRVQ